MVQRKRCSFATQLDSVLKRVNDGSWWARNARPGYKQPRVPIAFLRGDLIVVDPPALQLPFAAYIVLSPICHAPRETGTGACSVVVVCDR